MMNKYDKQTEQAGVKQNVTFWTISSALKVN